MIRKVLKLSGGEKGGMICFEIGKGGPREEARLQMPIAKVKGHQPHHVDLNPAQSETLGIMFPPRTV
jgi:hypothetical protein